MSQTFAASYVSDAPTLENVRVGKLDYEVEDSLTPTAGSDISSPRSKASSPTTVSQQVSIPTCPLCLRQMTDPVMVAETGHSYDRGCIEDWLAKHDTCPASGVLLKLKALMPNYIIRDIINQGLRQGPQLSYPRPKPGSKMNHQATIRASSDDLPDEWKEDTLSPHQSYELNDRAADALVSRHIVQHETEYDTLIDLLSSDPPDLAEEALRVLLRQDATKLPELVDQGLVLGLVSVLDKGTPHGQEMAIAAFTTLTDNLPASIIDMFIEAGVVQCLVTLLLSPMLSCQTAAIGLLARLSTRYGFAVKLVDEGGLGAIVQLLFGGHMGCKEMAALTLANVARHEDDMLEHLAATPDAIKGLVPLLRSGFLVCQEHATYVLMLVARNNSHCEATVCKFPVIDPLVQLLWFAEGPTQLYAAQLLATLCSRQAGNCLMVSVAGAVTPLLKMLLYPERSHQVAAGELLVYLQRVKEAKKDVQAAYKALDNDTQKLIKKTVKALRLKLKL